jgi:bacterioferritin-associated ferredoxin
MYVCVCLGVTQSEVEDAIENGATTREAVTRACRAGGDCGACHGMIATMIEDHVDGAASLARCPVEESAPQLIPDAALVRTRAA